MESSLPISRKTLCSRYLKLTEDEEKLFSAMTTEVRHKEVIWCLNHRKIEMESGSIETLGDEYLQTFEDYKENEITKANVDLYRIGLRALAEAAARHVADKQAKMIDVGAGSGDFGVKLKEVGFTNIDALEPYDSLMNLMPKDLYRKIYNECILADKPTSIPMDTYDYVLAAGAIYTRHIEVEAVHELIRITKPGGCLIFNLADNWIEHKDFGARLDAWLQSRLEDGTLESVLKERGVYFYDKEDCNNYVVKKSLKN